MLSLAFFPNPNPNPTPICGRRIVAITPAFQAGDGGSIPLARSKIA
jgi:hypothetical protein